MGTQCRVSEAVPGPHVAHILFVIEEKVVVVLAGIAFAGQERDRVQMDAIDFGALENADVPEMRRPMHDRLHDVMEHGIVRLDVVLAGPASDQLRFFVDSRIGNMRDIRQRLERSPRGFFVTQIDG